MAETNKSKLMSEAEIIEAINSDSLVSVSLGAGQPQKNVKMSTLASVVAGQILSGYVFRRVATANNAHSVSINTNGFSPSGVPCRWELMGGQWNQKSICYAEGVCRPYEDQSSAVVNSSAGLQPSVSMTADGTLTVSFGTQLSYARLYLYNGY